MIRPQAGLLLRLRSSLVVGGHARPAAMKSATSLLLGAALATAFFLLYTSLCRDLGADANGSTPPRFETAGAAAGGGGDREAVRHLNHPKQQQEHVTKAKEEGKEVVTRSDGDGGERAEQKARGNKQPQQQQQQNDDDNDDLADLLRRAATPDKTVLMTAINSAWAAPGSFLDLFLDSFRHGDGTSDLPKHLLIVSMDGTAHARCLAAHAFCYWLRVAGMDFAGEQKYMKGDYLEMMWRRNVLQRRVLELGYSFLFTDVDILWFRPPFPRLPAGADVVMSSDFFVGDPASPGNYPNGGLLYVRASPAAVAFYEQWQASRARFPGKHEQYVFDMIVKEGVPARIGAAVRFLDTAVFGGFCQHGKDLGRVATMHANCCVGLENKLFDLKNVLEDWKEYRKRVAGGGDARGFSWRVPGRCIH
ncbi:unnamed protein product [Urochloa decumbens]|uniref:Nucleotide-diphospho-sugar transferase domain-containing protein n=1 Tax=Urochloa decumbens TaxID=240449 RepID=A0ABC9FIX0_9POAL